MATILLKKINKVYDSGVQAVFDADLAIQDGEFLTIVGPSGAGKSSVLRMIAGLESITSGELYIGDTMRAVAIAMYITCVIPVIALGNLGVGGLGVCLMFLMIAAATALLIMASDKDDDDEDVKVAKANSPRQELKNSIDKFIGAIGLALYLIISITTGAWYITWLIFPIKGCVKGLIHAIIDLKEACKNEN